MLTIILSGPKSSEQQARTALASAGHAVQATAHDHGLAETVTGKKIRQAVAFLTVEGEDIDAVAATVQPLGYALRMHHKTPEPQPPSVEAQLASTIADMQREIAELKAKVGD